MQIRLQLNADTHTAIFPCDHEQSVTKTYTPKQQRVACVLTCGQPHVAALWCHPVDEAAERLENTRVGLVAAEPEPRSDMQSEATTTGNQSKYTRESQSTADCL